MLGELGRLLRGRDRGQPIVRPNLTTAEIGRRLGTPVPSAAQIEQVRAEEEDRHQQEMSRELQRNRGALKRVALGLVSLTFGIPFLAEAMKRLGGRFLARSDELRIFSPTIANAFARMERQTAVLNLSQARGTSGTTRQLSGAYMRLRETTQPFRQAGANVFNKVLTGFLVTADFALKLWIRLHPLIMKAIEKAAELEAGKEELRQSAYMEHLQKMASGDFGPITGDPKDGIPVRPGRPNPLGGRRGR